VASPLAGSPRSYVGQMRRVVSELVPQLDGDIVIAGDFNSPIPSTLAAHVRLDRELQQVGLGDCFLHARGTAVEAAYSTGGPASAEATLYHQRQIDRAFHVDHVYAPLRWLTDGVTVAIGTYEQWVEPGHSDHVPVTVDLRPSAGGIDGGTEALGDCQSSAAQHR